MKQDIFSYVKNKTGYTLIATFYKNDKKILETGLSQFLVFDEISSLTEMELQFILDPMQIHEICTKLSFDLEKSSSFFYFSKVHIEIFNSLGIPIREYSSFVSQTKLEDYYSDKKKFTFYANPLPWFLQKSNNYRVYIDKKVEDIIKDVFSDFEKMSFIKFNVKFKFSPEKDTIRINCIQNGESDWDFILRLIDEEDWDFIFTYEKGEQIFHILNDVNLINTLISESKYRKIALDIEDNSQNLIKSEDNPLKEALAFRKERITNINFVYSGAPIEIDSFDSDHRNFGKVMKKESEKKSGDHLLKVKQRLGFEGAKKYKEKASSVKFLENKTTSLEKKVNSNLKNISAISSSLKIHIGSMISANYNSSQKKPLTSHLNEIKDYRVQSYTFVFMYVGGDEFHYETNIILHHKDVQHNVSHKYNRNYIDGTITAKVYGEEYELNLDENYFIKVQLPWQYDKYSDKAEYIYARYMSPWANKSYGFFAIPRGGEEVLVAFEDGDPDLPVVIGGLYNEKRPAPISNLKKQHILALYDQPSENKKNNFLEMDHKTATVNIAAAKHMRIRSFGDHLTQSKLTMTMRTSENMLSKSKLQMEFITDKNMLSTSKEQMECKTEKNMLHESKEQMEFISKKNMLHESKEHMDFITENKMSFEAEKNIEFKTDKEYLLDAIENIKIKSEKEVVTEAQDKISLNSQKEVIITVGSAQVKIESSGLVSIKCKKMNINSASSKIEIE
ncbi:hypothetical protein GCL60_06855 [Silvanigrella paludirubra]|uniref:Gp5/Type VI secretion system Vgr protein OB-fold domain-containing protein n=1 Tax=Silvanigrella paludirubra TaxID=2499159 RepID=A0A6N6VYL0_9BACT|nr:contractile injection system protein, VgrG/Pvc8 family [Silvanigrella paludirubra]KAB8039976.1 hypothetical protein GCL60_06855 [Silvanigrella paludirubra]